MPARLLSSYSFQISSAFLLLLLLFAGASLYSLGSFERQIAYGSLIDTAEKLELTAQHLYMQAMNYEQNAPRDYPTSYRDVRLYYQDLISHIEIVDQVVENFMHEDFRGKMDGLLPWLQPSVGTDVTGSICAMERSGPSTGSDTSRPSDRTRKNPARAWLCSTQTVPPCAWR